MYTALTIAGSDSSGGAGIQADIKTMTALGVYAESCITALTAQNTMGVKSIMEVSEQFVGEQMDCIFEDIVPDAVKLGMIPNAALMRVVAGRLQMYAPRNIVIDPVMVSTSGSKLMQDQALDTLKHTIFPLKGLITPNIPEAEILCGMKIHTQRDMETAAHIFYEQYGCPILLKGGHGTQEALDYLYGEGMDKWYFSKRIENPNTHGTGCTLSSAIAAYLARGEEMTVAVTKAKEYLTGAIAAGLNLGKGAGPLNHMYQIS